MFDPSVYDNRRAYLRKILMEGGETEGLVLFAGNQESPANYADNCYQFRQDSGFLYYFGLDLPDMAATIDLDSGRAVLYGDDLGIDDIVWTGRQPSIASLAERAGVHESRPRSALASGIAAAATLLFLPPYRADTRLELSELSGIPVGDVSRMASLPLIRAVISQREIKREEEIAEIETAVGISVEMHQAAMAIARPGLREADIAARVAEVAIARGGGLAFPTIATTKGAVLHNHAYGNVLEEGGLFLLDAGAQSREYYAGDISSTFPIGRRFDSRQREIYEVVESAHHAACSALKPGIPFLDVHMAAARAIASGLAGLGLMRGDPDEAVALGAHALFFPCGVGHMMGLDVHDMENYGERWVGYDGGPRSGLFGLKSLRLAKPLRSGMVHTIEPGIYFIPELIEQWRSEGRFSDFIAYERLESFMGVGGIRNEEDWLITPTGARRLGPAFDKSIPAVERAASWK